MFSTKMTNSVFCNKPNLTNVVLKNNSNSAKNYIYKYNFTVGDISAIRLLEDLRHVRMKMKTLLDNGKALQKIKDTFCNIPQTLKQQSAGVLRIWAHQCECVLAQRLRRGQQMFCLYTRLWEEHALNEFLLRMRNQITKRSKEFLLSASGLAAYNWEANRISDKDLKNRITELDYIELLKNKTLFCKNCNKRKCISSSDTDCCVCDGAATQKLSYDKWSPFIEKKDILVWRRLHSDGTGHYEYKVYGSFNDVVAEDFLNVQIDTQYRKTWDTTAVMLEVVERDPQDSSNSEIIYWEMLWPKLFLNRDYVFNRRFIVDHDTKTIIIVSRGTEHPACPERSDKYRIQDYWSEMIIRPYTELDKPGIEFGLTYFDNPGVSIPATVTTWVAMRAMPDFLMRLRAASVDYRSYCEKHGKQFVYSCIKRVSGGKVDEIDDTCVIFKEMEEVIIDNTIFEAQHPFKGPVLISQSSRSKSKDTKHDMETSNKGHSGSNLDSAHDTTLPVVKSEMHSHDGWKYFKPNYYFS